MRRRRGHKRRDLDFVGADGALEIAMKRYQLADDGPHGWEHWIRVFYTGCDIAEAMGNLEEFMAPLYHYAVFHDCCRENEHHDQRHGHRAADFFGRLARDQLVPQVQLSHRWRNAVEVAILFHARGSKTDDPFLGVCWDANLLDLPRLGIRVDPDWLNTDAARRHFFKRGKQ